MTFTSYDHEIAKVFRIALEDAPTHRERALDAELSMALAIATRAQDERESMRKSRNAWRANFAVFLMFGALVFMIWIGCKAGGIS